MSRTVDLVIEWEELVELEKIWRHFGRFKEAAAVAAQRLAYEMKWGAPVYRGKPNKWVVPGALMDGILASENPEKTKQQAKAVYDIYFDPQMNNIFRKQNMRKLWARKLGIYIDSSPSHKGKSKDYYYYPASQEYGFRTRASFKSKQRGKASRVPGRYFMRDAAINYGPVFERAVANAVERELM